MSATASPRSTCLLQQVQGYFVRQYFVGDQKAEKPKAAAELRTSLPSLSLWDPERYFVYVVTSQVLSKDNHTSTSSRQSMPAPVFSSCQGTSFGSLRLFILSFPFGFNLSPLALSQGRRQGTKKKTKSFLSLWSFQFCKDRGKTRKTKERQHQKEKKKAKGSQRVRTGEARVIFAGYAKGSRQPPKYRLIISPVMRHTPRDLEISCELLGMVFQVGFF